MAKKKDLTTDNEIFVAQKLAEDELDTNEINEPLERLDFKSFDSNKELLDYQQQALINAFRMLVAYFKDFKGSKKNFTHFTRSIIRSLIAISLKRNSILC